MAIITLSRQIAAYGDEVAQELAKKLNYKFVSRKDIEERIIELGFPKAKMSKYDERKPGFFASLTKDRDEYLNYVQYAILEAADNKNVIIIGRGAFAVLQNVPNNISVRLVADQKTRVERLQKEFTISEKQALQRMQESDNNRKGFHKGFYNVDVEDPAFFHAVYNTGLLSIDETAGLIAELVKKHISSEQEAEGEKAIHQLITAQRMVNKLYFNYKVNIEFMHAIIEDKLITLHGVADSPAVVEKALQIIKQELPDYDAKSAVSIVQDFKTFQ